MRAIYSV